MLLTGNSLSIGENTVPFPNGELWSRVNSLQRFAERFHETEFSGDLLF